MYISLFIVLILKYGYDNNNTIPNILILLYSTSIDGGLRAHA